MKTIFLKTMDYISAYLLFSMSMCTLFGLAYSAETSAVVLKVSPSKWVNVGDSVTLSCEVTDPGFHTEWRFSWYRAFPGSEGPETVEQNGKRHSVERLPDSQRGAGGVYSLSPVNRNHTGVYACRAEKSGSASKTFYSTPQLLWVTDASPPPASLSISPNRSQHFCGESIILSCEVQGNSSGWRLVMLTNQELSNCNPTVQGPQGLTCNITGIHIYESGVYWCEFGTGMYSNAINVTVAGGDTILESLILPLAEGDSLTLRCLVKAGTENGLEAWEFYKDGLLIKTQSMNMMTIQNVSKSDEGMYKCKGPTHRESPSSWVAVRGSGSDSSPKGLHMNEIVGLGLGILAFVILISVIVTIFCLKSSKGPDVVAHPADVTYAEVRLRNPSTPRETSDSHPSPSDNMYSEVMKDTAAVESEDVIYTSVVIKERGRGTSQREKDT